MVKLLWSPKVFLSSVKLLRKLSIWLKIKMLPIQKARNRCQVYHPIGYNRPVGCAGGASQIADPVNERNGKTKKKPKKRAYSQHCVNR